MAGDFGSATGLVDDLLGTRDQEGLAIDLIVVANAGGQVSGVVGPDVIAFELGVGRVGGRQSFGLPFGVNGVDLLGSDVAD